MTVYELTSISRLRHCLGNLALVSHAGVLCQDLCAVRAVAFASIHGPLEGVSFPAKDIVGMLSVSSARFGRSAKIFPLFPSDEPRVEGALTCRRYSNIMTVRSRASPPYR